MGSKIPYEKMELLLAELMQWSFHHTQGALSAIELIEISVAEGETLEEQMKIFQILKSIINKHVELIESVRNHQRELFEGETD